MKLGVVTTSFPRSPGDPAGSFVLELSLALARRGHEIEVVAPDPGRGEPPSWPGVDVRWARYLAPRPLQRLCYGAGIPENLRRRPWLALEAPLLCAALAREARRRAARWDGVISHWLVPSGLMADLACRGSMPHVAVAHSGDVWLLGRAPALGGAVVARLARRASAVAAVNPALAASIRELVPPGLPLDCRVLRLGPDRHPPAPPDLRQRLAGRLAERGISPASTVVAMISRLVPIKGADVLLRALAGPRSSACSAVVAGDGPERPRLESMARELGVRALFLGAVGVGERSALLERADILAVPSLVMPSGRSEGTPVVAVEGMAAGVPVVASDVGGLRWALEGAGLLVPPGSVPALAGALDRLRCDAALRATIGREGRRRARSFGWGAAAGQIEALLRGGELLSLPRGREPALSRAG